VAVTEYHAGDWPPYCLRVTSRCLREDLGEPFDSSRPSEELSHDLARAFVEKRSNDPKGQETIQPLTNMNEVYSLHGGRWRGATWHDEVERVVWLLAGAVHRSGARDDLYPLARSLDAVGHLGPTARDYELLFEARERDFLDVAYEQAEVLLQRATTNAPREVSEVLGGRVPISLAIEDVDGMKMQSLAISWRWVEGELEPPEDLLPILLAFFFPWLTRPLEEASLERTIAGRSARAGEQIWAAFVES
jgi:hypothetical protein